ncbi:MAG: polysaccharide deacetylase family protein [Selenomonadaceae bacterium]|nr:polysaccharide deacetylase family protein [Selenomonadaceae bacterium]
MLLTFDDGYIDNFLVAFPLLKAHNFQGSFFIPGKTFTENVLLDVNKIHFILASADNSKMLMDDVISEINRVRAEGRNDFPTNAELIEKYAKANRFDDKETVFVKRVLQTALPEDIRNKISSKLFAKYVGLAEDKFARELYMNRDQIKLMKDAGMFIGLHGYDHYWLGNLPVDEMRADIDKSLEVMSEFIDIKSWVMNYPYGNCNAEVINYISDKGCALGLTTEVRAADVTKDNKYLLPRLDCNDFPPKSDNYKKF